MSAATTTPTSADPAVTAPTPTSADPAGTGPSATTGTATSADPAGTGPNVATTSATTASADPAGTGPGSATAPAVTGPSAVRRAGSLRRTTVVAGLVAAAVTTAAAAAAHAAGVSFEIDGEMIPLAGVAQMTFLGAVIGGVVLAVLVRRSRSARRRFLQTTVALTVLSCVPSLTWPDDTATKLTLVALHLLAAALVVPVLARHAQR